MANSVARRNPIETVGALAVDAFVPSAQKLAKRWLVLRDVHDDSRLRLFQPR